MAEKDRTRVCRYIHCKHGGKIHINTEKFVKDNKGFYHEDCYKEKTDLQLFRNLWCEHISQTVVFSDLNRTLNQLLSKRGVSAAYLLFVLEYVIDHKYGLRYPAGFRYYVDNRDIRAAYEKKNQKVVSQYDFVADDSEGNAPKFSIYRKPSGFNNILRR